MNRNSCLSYRQAGFPTKTWLLNLSLLATFAASAIAGPKGEITVRPLGGARIKIDGDISDWPLDKFKKVAEQPVFPGGQNAAATTAKGDHIVFDRTRIGLFNGTTAEAFQANDSDFGSTIYFAHDGRFLYLLAVCIDDKFRDDRDTTEYGATGFLNDGFEFFLDAKGDSTDCIADDSFPNVDLAEPNTDDFQVTVGLNSKFKPAGSGADVLGARQTVERGGNPDLIGPDKGGPGGIYRDMLTAFRPDMAARKYTDLRAAGAKNRELAAKPAVTFSGYVIEMRIPMGNRIPELNMGRPIGFELFWRDVDAITDEPGGKDVGAGGGDISWASWGQSTDVPCTNPQISLFNTANWGALVFDQTDLLLPIPAGKGILFVSSNGEAPIDADPAIIDFLESKGYVATSFTAGGSTPEGLVAATAGQTVVLISETIGSTSVVDPPGAGTGIFSLKDTDIPVISFEAYMYDNADWVTRTESGANDFTQWGNSGRSEVADTPINDGRDSLFIRKADHPIVKGLSGKVKVYNELYSLNFGLPSADADIVASIQEDGTFPTIFVYEKGDKLVDGSVAPNKRIGFYLGQNAAPDFNTTLNFANLTTDGLTLLLNVLAFAGGNPGGAVAEGNFTGLAGYWRMNETSGTVVSDSSGKARNGTIVNNPAGTWVTDPERGAVYKSTGLSVINFGVIVPAMTTANDFTWSLWLKSDETGTPAAADNNIVFGNRYNTTGADFNPREFIKFTPSNFEWHFNTAGQNVDYTDFVVGKWTHHLVVKQGAKLTYYRDGVEANTRTITGGPRNAQPLYLGGQGTAERWRGAADEVAIFDRALSVAEVQQVFALGQAGQALVPAPIVLGAATVSGANLSLSWTGGKPPFKVQRRDNVASGAWTDVATTNDRTATVPLTGNAGFLRIAGQ